jgi:hypothetical protein
MYEERKMEDVERMILNGKLEHEEDLPGYHGLDEALFNVFREEHQVCSTGAVAS